MADLAPPPRRSRVAGLACAQWGPADADLTVLALPGLTSTSQNFNGLAALRPDVRLVTADLPGRGGSVDAAAAPGLPGHVAVVRDLADRAQWARRSLGDARLDRIGDDLRPIGRVEQPRRLTAFDVEHPYYMAEYDLSDRG